jgi:gentisate 1,2-dioxygenase
MSSVEPISSTAQADLARFSREIDKLDLSPLWERVSQMKPGSPCVPKIWHYEVLRPELMKAASLITKKQAERRVLVLENPSLRGTTFITNTLYAGMQIILPGEIAPAHRHSPNALRFIVEGQGAYTAVGGERTTMKPGDFIVTPNWRWHDHGNLGPGPVVWIDGLDTPFTKLCGAMFREEASEDSQPLEHHEGDAAANYASNMLPVDFKPETLESPILSYPYERTREALDQLSRSGPVHPAHGVKLRYVNPANGKHPFPTMAVFMQWLPGGFAGQAYRSTDGTVFAVVEGNGNVLIGNERYSFGPHDVFVVPPWYSYRINTNSEVVLFSYSDRAAQEALGFFKEQLMQDAKQ